MGRTGPARRAAVTVVRTGPAGAGGAAGGGTGGAGASAAGASASTAASAAASSSTSSSIGRGTCAATLGARRGAPGAWARAGGVTSPTGFSGSAFLRPRPALRASAAARASSAACWRAARSAATFSFCSRSCRSRSSSSSSLP